MNRPLIGIDRREVDAVRLKPAEIVDHVAVRARRAFVDRAEGEDVEAAPAPEPVESGAAAKIILAVAALQNVVAGLAEQRIAAGITDERVGGGSADDVFDVADRV